MRRAVKLTQLVQQAGALEVARTNAANQAVCALPQMVRQMGAPAGDHAHHETPMSKFMPQVVALPRQVITTAFSLTGKAVAALATSGQAKQVVTSIADKVVVSEAVFNLKESDPSFWAHWLSTAGYSDAAGFKKIAAAAVEKVPSLSTSQVARLAAAFAKVGVYDKPLFTAVGAHVSANYTKYETEEALAVASAFAQFDHFSAEVFDDLADSITYCNHYMAPIKCCPLAIAKTLAAFAKFNHERADCFHTLARGLSEVALDAVTPEQRKETVLTALRAFHSFQCFPENVDALFYYAKAEPGLFSEAEAAEINKILVVVEEQVGGKLEIFKEGADVDSCHWYGHHAPATPSYNLYVFRDALVPKEYSPASVRPSK